MIRITIDGGDLWQRTVLANEIYTLLESLDIGVGLEGATTIAVHDDDEHHRHLQHIATNTPVVLEVKP